MMSPVGISVRIGRRSFQVAQGPSLLDRSGDDDISFTCSRAYCVRRARFQSAGRNELGVPKDQREASSSSRVLVQDDARRLTNSRPFNHNRQTINVDQPPSGGHQTRIASSNVVRRSIPLETQFRNGPTEISLAVGSLNSLSLFRRQNIFSRLRVSFNYFKLIFDRQRRPATRHQHAEMKLEMSMNGNLTNRSLFEIARREEVRKRGKFIIEWKSSANRRSYYVR